MRACGVAYAEWDDAGLLLSAELGPVPAAAPEPEAPPSDAELEAAALAEKRERYAEILAASGMALSDAALRRLP